LYIGSTGVARHLVGATIVDGRHRRYGDIALAITERDPGRYGKPGRS
jgi:hypothetical protein